MLNFTNWASAANYFYTKVTVKEVKSMGKDDNGFGIRQNNLYLANFYYYSSAHEQVLLKSY